MTKLGKSSGPGLSLLLDELLTVVVHLKLGDNKVGWVDWESDVLTVILDLAAVLDDDPHLTKPDLKDLAVDAALADGALDLIIAVDWEPLDAMGLLKFLGKWSAESDVLGLLIGVEVLLAALAGLGGNEWIAHVSERPQLLSLFSIERG